MIISAAVIYTFLLKRLWRSKNKHFCKHQLFQRIAHKKYSIVLNKTLLSVLLIKNTYQLSATRGMKLLHFIPSEC